MTESPDALKPVSIRDAEPRDRDSLLRCIAALQDGEREVDSRLPPGAAIAEAYLSEVERRCVQWSGRVLVAELAGTVVGFASIYVRVPLEMADDPAGTFALLGDLAVLPSARGQHVGRALTESAEEVARGSGARDLRVDVLAGNLAATRLYDAAGFAPYLVTMRKPLDDVGASGTGGRRGK